MSPEYTQNRLWIRRVLDTFLIYHKGGPRVIHSLSSPKSVSHERGDKIIMDYVVSSHNSQKWVRTVSLKFWVILTPILGAHNFTHRGQKPWKHEFFQNFNIFPRRKTPQESLFFHFVRIFSPKPPQTLFFRASENRKSKKKILGLENFSKSKRGGHDGDFFFLKIPPKREKHIFGEFQR